MSLFHLHSWKTFLLHIVSHLMITLIFSTAFSISVVVNFMCQSDRAKGHLPRQLVKHYFWACLWGCFWKRLASESTDWVKIILTNASRYIITSLDQTEQKVQGGQICSLCLSWISIHLLQLIDTSSPGSQAFGSGLEPHHQLSWASSQQKANCGTSHPPYHVSESLLTNLCISSLGSENPG